MESEIQRKKEHLNTATNFEKARGFVRTDFKSKKFDPNRNPCEESSSTDESEIERRQAAENVDRFSDDFALNKSLNRKRGDMSQESTNELIDISVMSEVPSCRPDVETQLETLKAIHEYNKKLPKRRKKKDSLSECSVTNIVATSTIARKTNKKTKKKTIDLVTHYKPVGITDGTTATPFSKDKYSLTNK